METPGPRAPDAPPQRCCPQPRSMPISRCAWQTDRAASLHPALVIVEHSAGNAPRSRGPQRHGKPTGPPPMMVTGWRTGVGASDRRARIGVERKVRDSDRAMYRGYRRAWAHVEVGKELVELGGSIAANGPVAHAACPRWWIWCGTDAAQVPIRSCQPAPPGRSGRRRSARRSASVIHAEGHEPAQSLTACAAPARRGWRMSGRSKIDRPPRQGQRVDVVEIDAQWMCSASAPATGEPGARGGGRRPSGQTQHHAVKRPVARRLFRGETEIGMAHPHHSCMRGPHISASRSRPSRMPRMVGRAPRHGRGRTLQGRQCS